jgi:transcriptional regulator with XRE-family HTH domain
MVTGLLHMGTFLYMTPPIPAPTSGLNAAVAAELRAAAGRQKMTVPALAERAGIPYGSLRRYLNAERHIDVSVLHQLTTALGVSVSDLIEMAERHRQDEGVVIGVEFGATDRTEEVAAHDSVGTIEDEQEASDTP